MYESNAAQFKTSSKEYSPDCNPTAVSSEDIAYLLREEHHYTWDEFYETLEKERTSGVKNCPQASYIALELLTPQIMQLPFRSMRTNSETPKDIIQDAYLTIAEHIENFDRSQSAFKTYMMKWFQGLARETRSDGISDYQQKQLGFRVYSSDAMVSKNNSDGDAEAAIDFIDEGSAVEDIIDKKEKLRSNELLHQMLGNNTDMADEETKRNVCTNAACYHLFLGGISNLPDDMKDELEEIIAEQLKDNSEFGMRNAE